MELNKEANGGTLYNPLNRSQGPDLKVVEIKVRDKNENGGMDMGTSYYCCKSVDLH